MIYLKLHVLEFNYDTFMCASMYTIGKHIHIEWSKWGDVYKIEGQLSMIDDKSSIP